MDKYSNDNFIGIVLSGYLDSNNKLLDREELNKRITSIKKENEELREFIKTICNDLPGESLLAEKAKQILNK